MSDFFVSEEIKDSITLDDSVEPKDFAVGFVFGPKKTRFSGTMNAAQIDENGSLKIDFRCGIETALSFFRFFSSNKNIVIDKIIDESNMFSSFANMSISSVVLHDFDVNGIVTVGIDFKPNS